MNAELSSLAWVSTFTALLWIPYVLNRMAVSGIDGTIGYPTDPAALAPWALRLRAAHANAVENLVVFAALMLAVEAAGIRTTLTATAGLLYLWSRILHAAAYTLAVRWIRTLAFVGGFAAQMVLAWQLLAA